MVSTLISSRTMRRFSRPKDRPIGACSGVVEIGTGIITGGTVARAAAPNWKTPTLLMYSGENRFDDARGSMELASLAPASAVPSHRFVALYHERFNERASAETVRMLVAWLRQLASATR